ncbi:MAG: YbjQ family protein [Leptolyngbyaceae cyanobacterium]
MSDYDAGSDRPMRKLSMTARPPLSRSSKMILTTLEGVPGHTIVKHLGLVQGSTVRAKNVGKDILAGFKNLVGGELKGYTELLQEARHEATQRMMLEASQKGANAVINIRYATSSLAQGAAELFVYGTAVQID